MVLTLIPSGVDSAYITAQLYCGPKLHQVLAKLALGGLGSGVRILPPHPLTLLFRYSDTQHWVQSQAYICWMEGYNIILIDPP